jgi:hypothetical protein
MRQSRPLLPIRPLVNPARLGHRQHGLALSATGSEARVRFEQSNLAVALASRPVWLRGPLFKFSRSQPSSAVERHAA